jgi:putative tryptophan/tyrosine transport system substrate-binding protein
LAFENPRRVHTTLVIWKRREFIALLGGTAAWPVAVRAQQAAMPVVGYLGSSSPEDDAFRVDAFRRGLNTAGYIEGQNVLIEYRWAEAQYDRLPALAANLVARKVDVIAAMGASAAGRAAQAASTTVPIVFVTGGDPVKLGLVTSFNRPTGNLTGVSILTGLLVEKRAELLHEMVPIAGLVGFLVHPNSPVTAIPTIYPSREFAVAGGLFSYGPDLADAGGRPEKDAGSSENAWEETTRGKSQQ